MERRPAAGAGRTGFRQDARARHAGRADYRAERRSVGSCLDRHEQGGGRDARAGGAASGPPGGLRPPVHVPRVRRRRPAPARESRGIAAGLHAAHPGRGSSRHSRRGRGRTARRRRPAAAGSPESPRPGRPAVRRVVRWRSQRADAGSHARMAAPVARGVLQDPRRRQPAGLRKPAAFRAPSVEGEAGRRAGRASRVDPRVRRRVSGHQQGAIRSASVDRARKAARPVRGRRRRPDHLPVERRQPGTTGGVAARLRPGRRPASGVLPLSGVHHRDRQPSDRAQRAPHAGQAPPDVGGRGGAR